MVVDLAVDLQELFLVQVGLLAGLRVVLWVVWVVPFEPLFI